MGLALHQSRFALASFKFNVYSVVIPEGDTLEDCQKPEYWAHVASKLRAGDEIRVVNDQSSLYARFYVLEAGNIWAKVAVIESAVLSASVPASVGDGVKIEVKFAGPHHRWRVTRLMGGNREILQANFETEDTAKAWAADYVKTIGQTKQAA